MKLLLTFLFSLVMPLHYSLCQTQEIICNDSIIKVEIVDNYNKIEKIQAENIDKLIINDCLLNDIEYKIEIINYCISANQNLKNRINAEFWKYYENLILQAFHKRKIINTYLLYSDYCFYSRALYYYSLSDTSRYLNFIENSLLINPKYLPSLYEKTKWLLNSGNVSECVEIIKSIKSFYQNNLDIPMLALLVDICDTKLVEKGFEYYKSGYFNESLMYFEYLDTVCSYYKSTNCFLAQNYVNLSKKGILQSYFSVAEQAIKAEKYAIAESFMNKAEDYAAMNMDENQEKSSINEKYKLISQKYLQLSAYYKRNNEKANSIYYLENANRICRKIYGTDCKTNLMAEEEPIMVLTDKRTISDTKIFNSEIDEPKKTTTPDKNFYMSKKSTNNSIKNYKRNLTQKANEAFDNAEYEKALLLYETLKQQPEYLTNIKVKQIDNYIQQAAIQVILSKINSADFYIWTNKLSAADSILNLCLESKRKYSLSDNSLLDISLNNFKNKIEEKKCRNIEDEIEISINIIESNVKNREFESILSISNKVDTLINKTNCLPLFVKPYTNSTKAVLDFYKKRSLAKEKFNEMQYLLFAEYYLASDNIFDIAKLESLGIIKIDVLSFIDYNYNFDAAISLFKIGLKDNLFELCINLLEIIKNKNTLSYNTKEMQTELATALMDFQTKKKISDRIVNTVSRIKKDKWFIYFNKNFKLKK